MAVNKDDHYYDYYKTFSLVVLSQLFHYVIGHIFVVHIHSKT